MAKKTKNISSQNINLGGDLNNNTNLSGIYLGLSSSIVSTSNATLTLSNNAVSTISAGTSPFVGYSQIPKEVEYLVLGTKIKVASIYNKSESIPCPILHTSKSLQKLTDERVPMYAPRLKLRGNYKVRLLLIDALRFRRVCDALP